MGTAMGASSIKRRNVGSMGKQSEQNKTVVTTVACPSLHGERIYGQNGSFKKASRVERSTLEDHSDVI